MKIGEITCGCHFFVTPSKEISLIATEMMFGYATEMMVVIFSCRNSIMIWRSFLCVVYWSRLDVCAVSTSTILAQYNSSGSVVKFSWPCLHGKLLLLSCMTTASCFSSFCVNGLIWSFREARDWYLGWLFSIHPLLVDDATNCRIASYDFCSGFSSLELFLGLIVLVWFFFVSDYFRTRCLSP